MRILIVSAALAAFLAGCNTTQSSSQSVLWPPPAVAGR